MCHIASRRLYNGKWYMPTSKEVKKYLRNHPDKTWEDLSGHTGIDVLYPETKGKGVDEEWFPIPEELVPLWNSGAYDEINKNAYNIYCRVNSEGLLDGECKSWYSDGTRMKEDMYQNGELNGECKWWYSTGELGAQCVFKDNKQDGLYREWYSNGVLEVECCYKKDSLVGNYKGYYPNGQLKKELVYDENGCVISHTLYTSNSECVHLEVTDGFNTLELNGV